MGWQSEDGEHEGWDAAEFPGDRYQVGGSGGGVLVRHFPPGPGPLPDRIGEPEVADGRTAIGWRGLCECGWRGPLWARVAAAAHADVAGRLVYVPDPGVGGYAPEEVTEAIRGEWRAHLPPEALADVRRHAQAAADVQARLTEAVRRARRGGASWADIGQAAGITRQSAHERWAARA